KYNTAVGSHTNVNSFDKVLRLASSGSPESFLHLSYNVNARNIMFRATNDFRYLKENFTIIQRILDKGFKNSKNINFPKWFKAKSGNEVILYESFLLKYIVEFQHLIEENRENPAIYSLQIPVAVTEQWFLKWYSHSI